MWDVGDKNKTMFPMHGESQFHSSPGPLPPRVTPNFQRLLQRTSTFALHLPALSLCKTHRATVKHDELLDSNSRFRNSLYQTELHTALTLSLYQ